MRETGQKNHRRLRLAAAALLLLPAGLWLLFGRTPEVSQALDLAAQWLDLGAYARAEAAYAEILQKAPDNLQAKTGHRKAKILDSLFNTPAYSGERARQRLRDLLQHMPGDPHVLVGLGNVYERANEFERAAEVYLYALARRDSLTTARFGLGSVLLAQRDYPRAQAYLEKATAASPTALDYRRKLAAAYLLQGDSARALAHYEQALALDADFLLLYQEIAQAHWWRGEIEQALHWLARLEQRLDEENVLRQAKNQADWWFPSAHSGLVMTLAEWPDKRAYIYESLGAGWFLRADEARAQSYFVLAEAQKSALMGLVRLLVERDVAQAVKSAPHWAERAEALRLTGG